MPKMVHSCIRVLHDARSIAWYKNAFDLDLVDQLDFETFRLTYLANASSGFELELTVNKDRSDPYNLGDGYAHLAVVVDDLDNHHAKLKNMGMQIDDIINFAPGGALLARFFFATDPDGYKIEVIQRGGRFS